MGASFTEVKQPNPQQKPQHNNKNEIIKPPKPNNFKTQLMVYGYIRSIFNSIKNTDANEYIIYSTIPTTIFDLCAAYGLKDSRHICMLNNYGDNVNPHVGLSTSISHVKDLNSNEKIRGIFKKEYIINGKSYDGCLSLYVNNIHIQNNRQYNGMYDILFLLGGHNYTIHESNNHYDYKKGWNHKKDILNHYASMVLFDNYTAINKDDIPSWDTNKYDKYIYGYCIDLPWNDKLNKCTNLAYDNEFGLIVTIKNKFYHLKLFDNMDELKWNELKLFNCSNEIIALHIIQKHYSKYWFIYDIKHNIIMYDFNNKQFLNLNYDKIHDSIDCFEKSIYDKWNNRIYFIRMKNYNYWGYKSDDKLMTSYYFDINECKWVSMSSPKTYNSREGNLCIKYDYKRNIALLYVIDHDDQMEYYDIITNKWNVSKPSESSCRMVTECHVSYHYV